MLVLLPPSETKRSGGDRARAGLAYERELGDARARVRDALVALSRDTDAALAALKLGEKNRDELDRNLSLESSGAVPAVERYTGVLYDALGYDSLPDAGQAWVSRHVAIQSALFGLVRSTDTIPAYRLSAGTRLPGLSASLKQVWREAHRHMQWDSYSLILDLRSKAYADHAPVPGAYALQVTQQGPDGELRALNHFNKAAKGDLVRRLACDAVDIDSVHALLDWARETGVDLRGAPDALELTLVTELGAPTLVAR